MNVEVVEIEMSELLEMVNANKIPFDSFEGCLQDNYIFYDTENIVVDGKSAKYIIAKEKYLNCWSSGFTIIMTDSDVVTELYLSEFQSENNNN